MNVKLSVNGQDGGFIAQSAGLRNSQTQGAHQLQLYDKSIEYRRDGRPGMDAPGSIPGSPAGHLSVQILESPVIKGGIRAIVLASESSHELPSSVDVPVGRDLLLTAIGGNGENGINGEDGVDGRDGVNGVDASETTEATVRTNNVYTASFSTDNNTTEAMVASSAGHGGNGGDGGDGGTIEIVVHEDQAHLLMAAKWDLSGGRGGQPGKHGQPGRGGKGGKGGKGYKWERHDGYLYSCTSRCLGGDTTISSNSLVRSAENVRRNIALAGVSAQVVATRNPTQMIVQAGDYRSHTVCSRPFVQTHKRVAGLDGLNGRTGTPGTNVLHGGVDGLQGNVTIVVHKSDGSHQEFSSLYDLALPDFEVEDENGDGIFEPGEHLFVRRITVRNSGGMPSPTRPIQLKGSSVTIDGPIKVRIREQEQYENPETGALFIRHEAIHRNAIMPWIEREISNFDFNKVIEIKYPCELRNFKPWLRVYNHRTVSIGPQGYNSRVVEIDVSFPVAFGELESEPDQWRESVTITPRDIRGGKGLVLRRQLRVHSNAQSYQHVAALFKLYLGKPNQPEPDGQQKVNLVHVVEIRMQVSDHYVIHPGASFLLVTNSETVCERAQSIRRFINNSLGMEIDTWNTSLYAGLEMRDPDSGALKNVLSRYHGKTIIFLRNQFGFFGQGRKNIFDVCDPEAIATAAANDTNFIFLDILDFKSHDKLINEIPFWITQPIADTRANIGQSHQFHNINEFATVITQQKQYNNNLSHERYAITLSKKWHEAFLKPETLAKTIM
ncbi:hypothetical protein EV127DRAFT_502358 [Xylaria flabelliformis]|nr:hypothetical protein EV127DRAFT_502358 [Xylaria flabelliformis]